MLTSRCLSVESQTYPAAAATLGGQRHYRIGGNDEIQADVTNGQSTQIERDEAFYARIRAAIEAGLENAPIGVVGTPVPTERVPRVSSPRDMEHA